MLLHEAAVICNDDGFIVAKCTPELAELIVAIPAMVQAIAESLEELYPLYFTSFDHPEDGSSSERLMNLAEKFCSVEKINPYKY